MATETITASPATVVRSIVRERIESSPGMQNADVADLLLEEGLPPEVTAYLLRVALIGIAGCIDRDDRRVRSDREPNPSARWENARRCADVFQQVWPSSEGQKMLGDFTRDDAVWAAAYFEKLARGAAQSAAKFTALAQILPAKRPASALSREKVEAIFNA